MAQCKDIDAALKRLERAIANQGKCCNEVRDKIKNLENRIGALERANKNPSTNNKQQNLNDIYKRLQRLESYCSSIEAVLAGFANTLKLIKAIFLG
ncbi:hypothetical protein [Nostoc sp. CMAA1605]|uniref:hypothetical protein n=1 Tax=Nostoc sp. CMAA1605 TaxID=2055159 RepID=UPI001F27AADF|nr:hypothetical protein [Nostoc sp. CMAA1605]MCF4968706.1 hypothetical protein [Nostoc sp. CMAA1605]